MMKPIRLCFFLVLGLFVGCTSTVPSAGSREAGIPDAANPNQVEVGSNNTLQLSDYLRRVPGLQIEQRGNNVYVMIRGMNSISWDNSPLFVIDQQPVGNDYSDAAGAVDVNDIKTVNVIKGAEGQQLFGMRGANGVIQIITRKR